MIAFCTTALIVACRVQGISIDVRSAMALGAGNAALLLGAEMLRRRGWRRGADYFTASAQMALATTCLTALSYVMATFNLPLRDAALVAIDRSFGVDWQVLVGGFMRHPLAMLTLNYAYASFEYQVALVLPLLFLLGEGRSAARFVFAWCFALTVTVLVFPFVPALGGYLYFGIEQKAVPLVRVAAAWLFADLFLAARQAQEATLDLSKLDGIVTFPSFHAVTAILLAWACWRSRLLRWPSLILNTLMWLSAVPIGGHYVVDVVAGSVIGIASCLAAGLPAINVGAMSRFSAKQPAIADARS